ncbi:MAG TPA: nucleotidyltransferase family protein, partial [Syntrophales bacterium]|nr:nucleotidyltransferase family protein [Syntrophales bacterium]
MNSDETALSCFPNPLQELFLKACLASGAEAREAWEKWLPEADLERLDFGSSKLLPLLYKNLRAEGVEHPVMGRLKGAYRATWYRNQMMLNEASALAALFSRKGIDVLMLKGAALIHTAYGDVGARAMEDVDLLIPTKRAKDVFKLITLEGWTPDPWLPRFMEGSYFAIKHGFNFRHRTGHLIDLHWHALDECIGPQADDDFWVASRALDLRGWPARTLCAADHLLHTFAHGVRWNPVAPLRWVADAFWLVRVEGEKMDWQRLVEQARRRNLVLPVKAGLRYLGEAMGAPVPSSVLDDLDGSAVKPLEHVAFRLQTREPSVLGPLWRARRQYARYIRVTA